MIASIQAQEKKGAAFGIYADIVQYDLQAAGTTLHIKNLLGGSLEYNTSFYNRYFTALGYGYSTGENTGSWIGYKQNISVKNTSMNFYLFTKYYLAEPKKDDFLP